MKLVTSSQMRDIEQRAAEHGITTAALMEQAGLAVAQEAWLLLATLEGRHIVILVGPGNNGGDGLVAARHLHDWGAIAQVFTVRRRPTDANETQLIERGVTITDVSQDGEPASLESALREAELVVDALLGTGVSRPLEGPIAGMLDCVQQALQRPLPPKVLAVDLPTGVNADTGAVDPHTVHATATAALGFAKVGTHVSPGSEYAGQESVLDIGLPGQSAAQLPIDLLDERWARAALPSRPGDANKGTFGRLFVVAGSMNYIGAPALCCTGAYRAGAGLVTLACPPALLSPLAAKLTETTFMPLTELRQGYFEADAAASILRALRGYDVLLIGPGLGAEPPTQALVRALLSHVHESGITSGVVDADGINTLSKTTNWWGQVKIPLVLTPHPGEMARLAGSTVEEVQANRLEFAKRSAAEWKQTVCLKGANTIVAAPDGRIAVSPFANPALASAGTGDVLAGAIAGFLSQGLQPFEAAACGVYVHGLAGEHVRAELGSAGLLASDLLPALPLAMKQIRGESKPEPKIPASLFGGLGRAVQEPFGPAG